MCVKCSMISREQLAQRESIHIAIQRSKFNSASGQIILMNWQDLFCARCNQNEQPWFLNKNPFVLLCLKIDRSCYLLVQILSRLYTLPSKRKGNIAWSIRSFWTTKPEYSSIQLYVPLMQPQDNFGYRPPHKGEHGLQVSPGQDKEETHNVGEAPITEGEGWEEKKVGKSPMII